VASEPSSDFLQKTRHSGIAITKDVYGHVMAEQKQQAADAMSEALWGA
jgi:hypothetical protein